MKRVLVFLSARRMVLLRVFFSLAALAILAGYLLAPKELAARFDTLALALVGLTALPWLGALVEEFKIGGVEAKLPAIQQEAAGAADAAAEAREVAEELALSRDVEHSTPVDPDPSPAPSPGPLTAPSPAPLPASDVADTPTRGLDDETQTGDTPNPFQDSAPPRVELEYETPHPVTPVDAIVRLQQLAANYIAKRQVMTAGAMRTAAMTNIFADMQAAARPLGRDDRTIPTWLTSDDPGRQLAAVAWLRNFPAAEPVATYIDLIEHATEAFVQYWGLRALSGAISRLGAQKVSIADRIRLKELESMTRAGTDRHTQIRRINRAGCRVHEPADPVTQAEPQRAGNSRRITLPANRDISTMQCGGFEVRLTSGQSAGANFRCR